MKDSIDYLFKFLIIGNASAGKSSILCRFTENKFDDNRQHTIGVEFSSKIVKIDQKSIKLQVWDTAGQERFRSVTRSYYRGAVGALLVYDITDRNSYDSIGKWLEDVRNLADPSVVIILVGNKTDLESERQVSESEAQSFAAEHNLLFVETSAKSDFASVEEAFINVTRAVLHCVLVGSLDAGNVAMTRTMLSSNDQSTSSGGYQGRSLTTELRQATAGCDKLC